MILFILYGKILLGTYTMGQQPYPAPSRASVTYRLLVISQLFHFQSISLLMVWKSNLAKDSPEFLYLVHSKPHTL